MRRRASVQHAQMPKLECQRIGAQANGPACVEWRWLRRFGASPLNECARTQTRMRNAAKVAPSRAGATEERRTGWDRLWRSPSQFRTGTMLKLATPAEDASSSASNAGDTARERSTATTLNLQTGRLSTEVIVRLSRSKR